MRGLVCSIAVVFLFACTGEPMLAIREELCAIKPSGDALDSWAMAGEKLAVIYRDPTFEHGKFGGCSVDGYSGSSRVEPIYLPDDRYARRPEELSAIVLIETAKGPKLERVTAQRTLGQKTDTIIFEGNTTISLIDARSRKLMRQVSFPVRNVPKQVPQERLRLNKENNYEYVCEPTPEQVREYLPILLTAPQPDATR